MKKYIILILGLSFYIIGRFLFSSYSGYLSWAVTFLFFAYGFEWVYLFVMNRPMPAYVIGDSMEYDNPKMKIPRLIHFVFGLGVSIGASVI